MSQTVFFNGSYVPKDEVSISPDDRGFLFGDGVYEVVRMYGGHGFEIDGHERRLADGLRAIGITADAGLLPKVCEQLIERNDLRDRDAVVYVQVTRGVAPRAHHFPDPAVAPTVYAAAWEFTAKADPAVGVGVVTVPDHRWTRCDIKSVSLLANCLAAEQAAKAGAYEALLIRDGMVIEGTRSSLFGVVDGVVRTAPVNNYILPGITRAVAIELCESENLGVDQRPMTVEECGSADELFLAGTTTEIMPIVRVDDLPVGDGRPGPIAHRLARRFADRVGALAS